MSSDEPLKFEPYGSITIEMGRAELEDHEHFQARVSGDGIEGFLRSSPTALGVIIEVVQALPGAYGASVPG